MAFTTPHADLKLDGIEYPDLFNAEGLARLDALFLNELQHYNPFLHDNLLRYRQGMMKSEMETSEFLIACAKFLEKFLAKLFKIEDQLAVSKTLTITHNPISAFKKYFVLRRAKKDLMRVQLVSSFTELNTWLAQQLQQAAIKADDRELAIALLSIQYLSNAEQYQTEIEKLVQWCIAAMTTPEGQQWVTGFISFRIPERLDHQQLIPTIKDEQQRLQAPDQQLKLRNGFQLTDPRMTAREVQDEINYCIYCHDHAGDFCSRGFPTKKGDPAAGFKKNPLDVLLVGCPLEEKISEMHVLKKDGFTLGSLAMVMVDNPMCPATGHRICNDCMKACIYQKQEPVNIPQIETRVLTDVLDLPWGVEIYDLLTRWNPLRQKQWVMKAYNGLKVMIAGMGPAGFTLAHHLLLEGFAVVGFDGLKIEPLPETLLTQPIRRFADLKESLDERLMAGFGGVAEYGITVRWDKNFLKLIYLSLARRPYFQVFGSVRFGGTIKVEDAWDMGFDHFVVAVGAGLPKALPIPGSLAPGMRQANDFLMALQLGNGAKATSLSNLQIRLPAVVIGGGLTGVDTATEVQAYYITQVEKVLSRYQTLLKHYDESDILAPLDASSQLILKEFLEHARAIQSERDQASQRGEKPNFIRLLRRWGGVTIVYRRNLQDSPAYINNHEELKKALEEGIYYLEGLEPEAVQLDDFGHAEYFIAKKRLYDGERWITTQEEAKLPARAILVATGTQPNTAYEFEHRGTFKRINLQYEHYEENNGELSMPSHVVHCKVNDFGPFTSYQKDDKRISLIGDTHPIFHGSVVKAIASGMRTYPKILSALAAKLGGRGEDQEYQRFANQMQEYFQAKIVSIVRKNKNTFSLEIRAPFAAKHFKPGEFYRLQNYETNAPILANTLLQMEPMSLVAADCDKASGKLTFIVRESTVGARICATLKTDENVSLMGPTGVRAKIPSITDTTLILGDHFSLAFLRSYGKAIRQQGGKLIYVGYFESPHDIFDQHLLEQAADRIIWVTQSEKLKSVRSQDISIITQDPIEALNVYQKLGQAPQLADVDRVYVVGQTSLLRTFQTAKQQLSSLLTKNPKVYGSVYGNMQCMLKGVCAQCLQWQVDPATGKRTKAVFACSWQDQPLEIIDIDHVDERQMQNRLLETLNYLWIDHLFKTHPINLI